ncbi:MAG: hypothetical protein KAH33_01770 [Candidatus Delongbacteria bacterium]|nr:hypothetical protein [Candidatus Delongbacteria bacterium]
MVVITLSLVYLYMLLILSVRELYENPDKNILKRPTEKQIYYYDGDLSSGNSLPNVILGNYSIPHD